MTATTMFFAVFFAIICAVIVLAVASGFIAALGVLAATGGM